MRESGSLFEAVGEYLPQELCDVLLAEGGVRIERIVSRGHTSPEEGWYDQDEHEWVMVVQGEGHLEYENGAVKKLSAGEWLFLPAHTRHRVVYTDCSVDTIWLAFFF